MAISKRIREESVLELFSSPLKCSLISFSQGGDVVHMRVNVRDMKGKVKFYEQSAEIQFQTRSDSHTASVRFPYCQCQIPILPVSDSHEPIPCPLQLHVHICTQ